MYNRGFMFMICISNSLCATVFSCSSAELRIFYVQPRLHVHELKHEYFMYNRGFMYMSWITNNSCTSAVHVHDLMHDSLRTTMFSCAWPESRIIDVQPWFMYMTCITNISCTTVLHVHKWVTNILCTTVFSCTWPQSRMIFVHKLCTTVFSGTCATQICA